MFSPLRVDCIPNVRVSKQLRQRIYNEIVCKVCRALGLADWQMTSVSHINQKHVIDYLLKLKKHVWYGILAGVTYSLTFSKDNGAREREREIDKETERERERERENERER